MTKRASHFNNDPLPKPFQIFTFLHFWLSTAQIHSLPTHYGTIFHNHSYCPIICWICVNFSLSIFYTVSTFVEINLSQHWFQGQNEVSNIYKKPQNCTHKTNVLSITIMAELKMTTCWWLAELNPFLWSIFCPFPESS